MRRSVAAHDALVNNGHMAPVVTGLDHRTVDGRVVPRITGVGVTSPAMAGCLAPDVHFRALLPPRDVDVTGPEATLAEFRRWFGDESETLELVDATVGEVGTRLYLRWRVRLSPSDGTGAARLVEQHAFATVGERIESLNLLCSGFVPG